VKLDKFLIISIAVLVVILLIIILLGGAALLLFIAIKAGPFTGGSVLIQKNYDYNGTLNGFDHVNLQVKDINGHVTVKEGGSNAYDISVNTQGTQSDYSRYGVSFDQAGTSGNKTLDLTITDNSIMGFSPNSQYNADITVILPQNMAYTMTLDTVNGQIDAGQFNCDVLTMDTTNGELISTANANTASYNTVNGFISVATSATSGSINASTVNGEVDVSVPSGASVSINARLMNGRISTNMPIDVTGKGMLSLMGTTPNYSNGLSLRLSTMNGDINVNSA